MYDSLIEEHRHINVEHFDWYETVYSAWYEKLSAMGFTPGKFGFSGFWSQGDGANFTGMVYAKDMKQFMTANNLLEEFPAVAYFADYEGEGKVSITVKHDYSRYEHEYSADIEVNAHDDIYYIAEDVEDSTDLRDVLFCTMADKLHLEEQDAFQKRVTELLRDLMRQFYRDLEAEYEYLTSDECVLEYLKSNDMLESENEVA